MKTIYNQHDINHLIKGVDPSIEFEISFRKSADAVFSGRNKAYDPIILAALNHIESKYSLSTNLLFMVESAFVDDAGWGHYDIWLSKQNLPRETFSILSGHVFNEEFEITVLEETQTGDVESHYSPIIVLKCTD